MHYLIGFAVFQCFEYWAMKVNILIFHIQNVSQANMNAPTLVPSYIYHN